MCLNVTPDAEIKTAKRDMLVFKYTSKSRIDNDNFESSIQVYDYKRGKLQPNVEIKIWGSNTVEKGYHSLPSHYNSSYYRNAMFVIPKGSKFIEGTYDDDPCYVSSQIIYLGTYSFWKRIKYFFLGKKAFI